MMMFILHNKYSFFKHLSQVFGLNIQHHENVVLHGGREDIWSSPHFPRINIKFRISVI